MLSPSERIQLIKEISRRLSHEEWGIIDLTLKQHDLPWSDTWGPDNKLSYIIEMTSSAPDETLLEISRNLGNDHTLSGSTIDLKFWLIDHFRLFLCHISQYKQEAAELQSALLQFHISAFVAHADIEPTKEWQGEIEIALSTCDAIVGLLHPGFHQSKWTDQELGFAMGRGALPISIELGETPYGFIGKFQALTGKDKSSGELSSELFEILNNHKLTQKRMAEALAHRFVKSDNYAAAKENIELLEKVVYWDSTLSDRIRESIAQNNQISDAYGVPSAVEALIEKRS